MQISSYVVAIVSGVLLYSGLTSSLEQKFLRLRFQENIRLQQQRFKQEVLNSKAELLFKQAGYPFKLNNLRWMYIQFTLLGILAINYILIPLLTTGTYSLSAVIMLIVVFLFTWTSFKYSIIRYTLNKVGEYKKEKRNAELYSLYDMILSEVEMMNTTRINAYSLLRSLKPYFKELDGAMTRLLSNWTSSLGPEKALDLFAEELGTKEVKSLVTTLKRLDDSKKEAIVQSLTEMKDMFVLSQIESYRRRRKVYVDVANIPVKAAHFLIIFNFLVVIVYMVSNIMQNAKI